MRTVIAIVLLCQIACGGEDTRIRVLASKVRAAMNQQVLLPDEPPQVVVKPNVMRLELSGEHIAEQRYKVTLHTTTGCTPCERMKASLKADARLDVTESIDVIPNGVPTDVFPFVTFNDNSGLLRYNLTARTSDEVYDSIQRTLSPAPDTTSQPVSSPPVGVGGVLHAREQIQSAIDWFRWRVGEGKPVTFRWDRTGQTSFPLLKAGTDWSPLALFGRSGRVELSTKDPVNLPVDSLGFGYVIDGQDLLIDVDQTRFKRLLSAIERDDTPKPNGVGPATVLTVLSVIRSVYMLLHPQCDVQIGANVSAVATLVGDCLTIKFDQAPQLRIVTLFTMVLSVDRVEITAERVRLVFSGSRWIKERSFEVK